MLHIFNTKSFRCLYELFWCSHTSSKHLSRFWNLGILRQIRSSWWQLTLGVFKCCHYLKFIYHFIRNFKTTLDFFRIISSSLEIVWSKLDLITCPASSQTHLLVFEAFKLIKKSLYAIDRIIKLSSKQSFHKNVKLFWISSRWFAFHFWWWPSS